MLDAVIAGSGYGGSVMAARLSARGFRVLVAERGRRYRPRDLPRGLPGLVASHGRLWEMRFGRGTGVGFASGLGGASLVNYGITERPDDAVFAGWPITAAELAPLYERALRVLSPETSPRAGTLADRAFLDCVEPGRRVDLANTIDWAKCTDCGNCVPGCTRGAKRTLESTYLAISERGGAEVQVETEVVDLVALPGGGYSVALARAGRRAPQIVRARTVVLSCGTFGTLDLLHRLRGRLPLSHRFGQGMSMNGNALALLHSTRYPTACEKGAPITTAVRIPFDAPDGSRRTLTVMAGRVPASILDLAAAALAIGADFLATAAGGANREKLPLRAARRLADLVGLSDRGALSRTFIYKIDAGDSANGVAVFDSMGRSAIDWPDYALDPILRFAVGRLETWARATGGAVVLGPGTRPGIAGLGVHPLGGCSMGRSIEDGVVDSHGRVFDPRGDVYPGLVIADGSVLPTSLGVPSSLTIAAVAERIAEGAIRFLERPEHTPPERDRT